MTRNRTYAFVFVCQAGPLEAMALLLAASLHRFVRCEGEMIAAVPGPEEQWGTLRPQTREMLAALGVRVVRITNEIDPSYPIGNKVSALRVATDADRLVFLDTDVLLLDTFEDGARFDLPFAAKPADLLRPVGPRQWRRAYAAAGLTPPPGRVVTSLYGQMAPPYFNAGLLAVDPRTGIGDAWLDCCRRIDARWGIRLKRPHLDQIALPVALRKLGLCYECLELRYNYPAHLKAIDHNDPPLFAHYHAPSVLRREPVLVKLVRELSEEHSYLKQTLADDPEYAPILARRPASRLSGSRPTGPGAPRMACASPAPELIITGIPRSGTSYLCNLLHRFDNCVVLNEPDEVSRPLRREPIPYGVGTFFRDARREILEGRPIRNKLRDGRVTDETLDSNEATQYLPTVADEEFVLGVKNPLGFLSRLDDLRRAMPQARIVACVRNPFDTIASWKRSFPHLAEADVAELSSGGLRDPFLSDRKRAALKQVAAIREPSWRRAAWWCYLADLILDARLHLIVVPYVSAVTDPMAVVGQVLGDLQPGALREPVAPSEPRTAKRSELDDEDLQAIHALCGEAATALGVADVRREIGGGAWGRRESEAPVRSLTSTKLVGRREEAVRVMSQ